MTQSERVLAYLRAHPGATVMELSFGLQPFVANPRARISDLRAQGFVVEPVKRRDKATGFVVWEPCMVPGCESLGPSGLCPVHLARHPYLAESAS